MFAQNVDQKYREISAFGQPFASTMTLPDDWFLRTPLKDFDQNEELRVSLMKTRLQQSQLLTEAEWKQIEDFPIVSYPSIEQLRWYRATRNYLRNTSSAAERDRIVIDIRAAILSNPCGTRTHARDLMRAFFQSVPPDSRFYSIGQIAQLESEFRNRFIDEWDGDTTNVKSFFQLAPFIYEPSRRLLPLFFDPNIRKVGVWLDGIMATNPYFFMPHARGFFNYQIGLELLNEFDRILTLSQFSAGEITATGITQPEIVISGCATGHIESVTQNSEDGTYIFVIGNSYPHKNVIAGILGSLKFASDRSMQIVVLANLDQQSRRAVTDAIKSLGFDPTVVEFKKGMTDLEMEECYRQAFATVIPSFHEGFSLPVTESLAQQTPVLLSKIDAHRELLGDGEWFFTPSEPSSIAQALTSSFATKTRQQVLNAQIESFHKTYDEAKFSRVVRETAEWLSAP